MGKACSAAFGGGLQQFKDVLPRVLCSAGNKAVLALDARSKIWAMNALGQRAGAAAHAVAQRAQLWLAVCVRVQCLTVRGVCSCELRRRGRELDGACMCNVRRCFVELKAFAAAVLLVAAVVSVAPAAHEVAPVYFFDYCVAMRAQLAVCCLVRFVRLQLRVRCHRGGSVVRKGCFGPAAGAFKFCVGGGKLRQVQLQPCRDPVVPSTRRGKHRRALAAVVVQRFPAPNAAHAVARTARKAFLLVRPPCCRDDNICAASPRAPSAARDANDVIALCFRRLPRNCLLNLAHLSCQQGDIVVCNAADALALGYSCNHVRVVDRAQLLQGHLVEAFRDAACWGEAVVQARCDRGDHRLG